MHINKLDNIVNKWSNAYHITIKMKSINTEASTNTDFDIANNDEDPRFKAGDRLRISKYKNMFWQGYTPNWSDNFFIIKKSKNAVLSVIEWEYENTRISCENDLWVTNQIKFEITKSQKGKKAISD